MKCKMRFSLEQPEKVKLFVHEVMRGAKRGVFEKSTQFYSNFTYWPSRNNMRPWTKNMRFMLDLKDDEVMDVDLIVSEVTQLILRGLKP